VKRARPLQSSRARVQFSAPRASRRRFRTAGAREVGQRLEAALGAAGRIPINAVASAMLVIDADGAVRSMNQAAERLLGYERDQLLGRELELLVPDGSRNLHAALRNRFIAEPRARCMAGERPVVVRCRDGREVAVEIGLFPEVGPAGQASVAVCIGDLTGRRRAERALRDAQADIARVARVATLGTVVATIVHEINQPLAAIANNARACGRWLARGEIQAALQSAEAVVADAHRAGAIVAGVRALASKAPPHAEPVDLNDAIREATVFAHGLSDRRGVALDTCLSAELPPVRVDRIQLQQVLLNLVINAIEAMDEPAAGGPDRWRCARRAVVVSSERAGSDVVVSVRDTGPGLATGEADRIFEAFYTTKPRGMGVGLAVSRSIVEAHGGRLWVEADVAEGALFRFALPVE